MQPTQKNQSARGTGRGGRGGRGKGGDRSGTDRKPETTSPSAPRPSTRGASANKDNKRPLKETQPTPKVMKGNWRDEIPITDQLEQVVSLINTYKTSYVSAYTGTHLVSKAVSALCENPRARIVVCYSNAKVLEEARETFKSKAAVLAGPVDPEEILFDTPLILTTSNKARSILKAMAKQGLTTHIFLTGWETETAMENIILYSLIKHHKLDVRVVVHTPSKWLILPKSFDASKDDSIVFTDNRVRFLYYPHWVHTNSLITGLKGSTLVFGPHDIDLKMQAETIGAEYSHQYFGVRKQVDNVVCYMTQKTAYSRYEWDMFGNVSDECIVHYMCPEATVKTAALTHHDFDRYTDYVQIGVWFDRNKIPLNILPKEYAAKAQTVAVNIPRELEKEVLSLNKMGLSIQTSILNCQWSSANANLIKKLMRDNNKPSNRSYRRLLYLPILVSCLINKSPTYYGDIQSLKAFPGRNDIEILTGMWLDLINSHNYPFYLWDSQAKERVIKVWCAKNDMNPVAIRRVFDLISDLYNAAIDVIAGIVGELRKNIMLYDDFKALVTDELNTAMRYIKESGVYRIEGVKNLKTNKCLIPNPGGSIIALHKNDDMVLSYVSDLPLETRECKVEDMSIFAPL